MSSHSPLDPVSDSFLRGYPPSEQKAIRKYIDFLGAETGREPTLAEAIQSWETRFAQSWREEKGRKDRKAQLKEIDLHKWFLSQKEGRDVGFELAASDWAQNHAGPWREWWENLEH